jgi:hypothetical protein
LNRVGDYSGFVIRFLGVGYIVLWPLIEPTPLAASVLCGAAQPLAFVCNLPHVISLPIGLHVIGIVCAACVGLALAARPVARWRRERTQRSVLLAARVPAAAKRSFRQKPSRPYRRVRARDHFGLRNAPRSM